MAALLNEIWWNISRYLSLPDISRLCETCGRLHEVSFRSIPRALKEEVELIISSDEVILTKDFLQKYLSKSLRRLKIIVPELTLNYVNFLRDAFEVCTHIKGWLHGDINNRSVLLNHIFSHLNLP